MALPCRLTLTGCCTAAATVPFQDERREKAAAATPTVTWRPQIDSNRLPAGSISAGAGLGPRATGAISASAAAHRLLPTVSPLRAPFPGGVLVDPVATGALKSSLGPADGVLRVGEPRAPEATRAQLSCVKDLLKRTFYTVSDSSYCTPADRIGRNYSPTAQGLTMRQMKTVLAGSSGPSAAAAAKSSGTAWTCNSRRRMPRTARAGAPYPRTAAVCT